jgi:hypothetical protein
MNRFIKGLKLLFCVSLCLASMKLFAQHEVHDENDSHDSHKSYHKNHIALFGGATSNFTHSSTHISVGLDYEYRWSKTFGTGLMIEYLNTEGGEFIGGFPFFVHLGKGLKLTLSPLFINKEVHHTNETTHHGEAERTTTFAFRTGVGYTFHLGKVSLEPALFFDAGESNALVYGITIGKGF